MMKQFMRASTVGINIVLATFVGLGMGWLIDNKLFNGKTSPWFTLIFLILGIVAGFRELFRLTGKTDGGKENNGDSKKGI